MTSAKLPSVREIRHLQDKVRRAIDFFPVGEKNHREGVDPADVKRFILSEVGPRHANHIALRKKGGSPIDEPEYALTYDGQLLFRVVWVPWPSRYEDGRWHVRRHPAATWWRKTARDQQRPI